MPAHPEFWRRARVFAVRIARIALPLIIGIGIGLGLMADVDPERRATIRICSRSASPGCSRSSACSPPGSCYRNRLLRAADRAAPKRAPRNCPTAIWELKEAEERARGFLEAQGDLIVRRDRDGRDHLCQRRLLRARRHERHDALIGTALHA